MRDTSNADLLKQLKSLVVGWENEVVEFKLATDKDDKTFPDKIGRYFSALSNEGNLKDAEAAWLILGVDNKTRSVTGTNFRSKKEYLENLKAEIAENISPSATFRDIFEVYDDEKRVIMFKIPQAPLGIPLAWKGHYYARNGESLASMGLEKLDAIRQQTIGNDWTAQAVEDSDTSLIDEEAIEKAKNLFSMKHANKISIQEVNNWSNMAFLEKIKLARGKKLTRAAILLLGKPSSAYLLSPHPAQITYKEEGTNSYQHFYPPFLLSTSQLYQRVRNPQIRLLSDGNLFPVEIPKYDQKILLEAIHNSIAHQDYSRCGRIIVREYQDRLVFENEGSFFDGSPEDYTYGDKTPRRYRSPFLAQAMTELNMIDTMGYGIRLMYKGQANRYFPMPDYELDDNCVKLTIYGKVVDEAYSRLLMQKTDLPIPDILALDRIQKKLPINDDLIRRLRKMGLIEGRKPNIRISAAVAKATDKREEYIRMRPQDDSFYAKLVTDYLLKFGRGTRKEIDKLLLNKLSEALGENQKVKKISNLLLKMRKDGLICNIGSRKSSVWVTQKTI